MLSRAGLEGTLKSQIKEFLVEMLLARFGSLDKLSRVFTLTLSKSTNPSERKNVLTIFSFPLIIDHM